VEAQHKVVSDLLIRQPVRQSFQDFLFASGQLIRRRSTAFHDCLPTC
jgi:hypothetical protein